ncbi:hypothetical protein FKW77_004131 [Venturia effusa]|uniref:Uncharacterized protein n=1 Tax=Venturia effusa TaxID=50376 RepID=A0A517LC80_9PEZI|nr:hypothetical protein FKW77_004131 [Venturia effusa]
MQAHALLVLVMVTFFGLVNSNPVDNRDTQAVQAAHHAAIIANKEAADAEMFPGYSIHTYTWTFEIHPGTANDTASFKGTIEHAMAQMNETYPGWRKEYDDHLAKNPLQERGLDDPDDYWNKRYDCGDGLVRGWRTALIGPIQDGVSYLRRQSGPVTLGMLYKFVAFDGRPISPLTARPDQYLESCQSAGDGRFVARREVGYSFRRKSI